ncbi:hypothetical protein [Flavobacterium sp. I3-2]|uniref:hypothetical protein n=1 Tax=Flavobacterium sp. I3-2 TaxID=2748319 RepID=UPI0015AD5949|nr:hypothetical protein [Flavobacterium sp. I3-2]
MIKDLISTVLILFFVNVYAQNNFDFYNVYELNISDLNNLTTNENYDFGYNFSIDSSKSIDLGYYLWIENTWYKVINDKEIFLVEKKSPLYFKVDKSNRKELQIKDSVGTVYSYKVELLESYLVSELIYKTNLNVIQNIAQAELIPIIDKSKAKIDEVVDVLPVALNDKDNLNSSKKINVANADAMFFNDATMLDENFNNQDDDVIMSEKNKVEIFELQSQNQIPKLMTGFFIAPNVELTISARNGRVLYFDLFDYYEKNFANLVVSSSKVPSEVKLSNLNFEYQVTFFNDQEIEILEISKTGVLKYKIMNSDSSKVSNINVRYFLK